MFAKQNILTHLKFIFKTNINRFLSFNFLGRMSEIVLIWNIIANFH